MDTIGIDAGGTWIKAGRFDGAFKQMATVKIESEASAGLDQYFKNIAAAVTELSAGDELAVGLSMPGLLSSDRKKNIYSPNIEGINGDTEGIIIADELAKHVEVKKLAVENDANCAALAEWKLGQGGGDKDKSLLHVTWGTGIGTGFVSNGRSNYGWEGGHVLVTKNKTLEQAIAVSVIESETGRDTEELIPLAEAGNEAAQHFLERYIHYLAQGLTIFSTIALPDVITLGGGVVASDWLVEEVKKEVKRQARGMLSRTINIDAIYQAKLGNDAGMIGAAILVQ